jgi:hypothetical protein
LHRENRAWFILHWVANRKISARSADPFAINAKGKDEKGLMWMHSPFAPGRCGAAGRIRPAQVLGEIGFSIKRLSSRLLSHRGLAKSVFARIARSNVEIEQWGPPQNWQQSQQQPPTGTIDIVQSAHCDSKRRY